jgi:hypothetical protein
VIGGTRTVWIRRPDGRPVRMWFLWGRDNSGLEWNDSRWREFEDGEYRLTLGALPPIPFLVRDGRAYLVDGGPLRLAG